MKKQGWLARIACLLFFASGIASAQTVSFSGGQDYSIDLAGGKVTLLVDGIVNSAYGVTGIMRLELWAAPVGTAGCGQYVGKLIATDELGTMAPGTTKTNIQDTIAIQDLPKAVGAYKLGLYVTQEAGGVLSHQNCIDLDGALHITIALNCASPVTVAPAVSTVIGAGTTGAFTVTAPAGCAWTGSSNSSWLTVSAGGNGSGTSTYLATANARQNQRTGYLMIAGTQVAVAQSPAVTGTVVEFFNPDLNNYFITADPTEQAMVDTGAVGRWQRTGNVFKAGGPHLVCRFYGNGLINPATGLIYGPNSHVYTADEAECAALKAMYSATAKSWKFESNDFATSTAANQSCPAGLVPVYRAYNNGSTRGIDSNHRITSNLAAYQTTVASGWAGEGVVLCAAQ